ncbi:glutathione S-transferase family protein [Alisedimentitalea sp. MJ-SS2]|uniref:glutathione S-transferase family protein n=1 Tax=Aliisedimentitalea sp. MJ-SS2 TaxID=3049795 RepID=UPI00290F129F|nr:glutathione S-transferase family protein [Alisedimentitalea sp. MJ-SS2]MDU8929024.1 glutathione S-transferase family protein [Alisedimentitalea sp. MJ-SS2]
MNVGTPVLNGFCHSVYTWSARIALVEKGVDYAYEEINPFNPDEAERGRLLHPFLRVPVLLHGGAKLFETVAILTYVDEAFEGPSLMPENGLARARAVQVMSITDAYVYKPLVRQVFSHGCYRALMGHECDPDVLRQGLNTAPVVLDALEEIAVEGLALKPGQAGLAEGHLFSQLDYFAMVREGRELLRMRPALRAWFDAMAERQAVIATRPNLMKGLE